MALNLKSIQGLTDAALKSQSTERKEALKVSVDDVVSKEQVRKEFDELEGLAETMKDEGQQSPIIVSPRNSEGKYVIQKGERRWRAIKLAGIDYIWIIVNDKVQTRSQEIIGELIENMQRQDLKPLEEAQGIQDALDADPSLNKSILAKKLGKSNAYVSLHLALLKMPACVRDLYDRNVTRDPETLNCLRQLYELDQQRCESVCQIALGNGITRKASRDIFRDTKEMQKGSQETPAGKDNSEPALGTESSSEDSSVENSGSGVADAANEEMSHESRIEADVSSQESSEQQSKGTVHSPASAGSATKSKKESDWYEVEPGNARIVVNVPTETDVKEGVLVLNRACDNPAEVYVRLTGKGGKLIKVLASEIDLVGLKPE